MQFFDLGAANQELRAALDEAYRRVMDSGWVIMGPELEALEAEFAAYCDAGHCVGVGNGLDALTLALRAAGIGPGDEVITPSHTFVATWLAVAQTGATLVAAEVDPATYTLDPAAVEAAITPRTAAIVPVSLYGHPADIDAMMEIADRRGLFVLEDAAQAHGARLRGRRVGTTAHATAFSFYPTKNLGALGDAGAVVTNDANLAQKVRALRNYGSAQKYVHTEKGVNSRLDELQAAFLRARLPALDAWNARRRALAAHYDRALSGANSLTRPAVASWAEHVFHLYVVRVADRDGVMARLKARGISTLAHYPIPCHLQGAFAEMGFRPGAMPLTEQIAGEVLSLPMWPQMDSADVTRVADHLIEVVAERELAASSVGRD